MHFKSGVIRRSRSTVCARRINEWIHPSSRVSAAYQTAHDAATILGRNEIHGQAVNTSRSPSCSRARNGEVLAFQCQRHGPTSAQGGAAGVPRPTRNPGSRSDFNPIAPTGRPSRASAAPVTPPGSLPLAARGLWSCRCRCGAPTKAQKPASSTIWGIVVHTSDGWPGGRA